MSKPTEDVLFLLKTRGPSHTVDIARLLGVTRQAVRQQVEKMAAEGLVQHVDERGGVGRPKKSWSLTQTGHQRFPDSHAQITVELIDAVREEFGASGLERLVKRREASMSEGYRRAMTKANSLEDRLAALARIRAAEGYMAEWTAQEDGSYLLLENHCPICAAAEACQGFCRSELTARKSATSPNACSTSPHETQ